MPKILVCINESEKKTFLPDPVWASLEALSENIVLHDSPGMNSGDLAECLDRCRRTLRCAALKMSAYWHIGGLPLTVGLGCLAGIG